MACCNSLSLLGTYLDVWLRAFLDSQSQYIWESSTLFVVCLVLKGNGRRPCVCVSVNCIVFAARVPWVPSKLLVFGLSVIQGPAGMRNPHETKMSVCVHDWYTVTEMHLELLYSWMWCTSNGSQHLGQTCWGHQSLQLSAA